MAEVQVTTDWIDHPPVQVEHPLTRRARRFQYRYSKPMWVAEDGNPIPVATLPILEGIDEYTLPFQSTEPGSIGMNGGTGNEDFYAVDMDNNWALQRPWELSFGGHYRNEVEVEFSAIAVVDSDGVDWAQTARIAIRDAFQEAHPEAIAPMVEFEFEGNIDGPRFGSHSNRVLYFDLAPEIFSEKWRYLATDDGWDEFLEPVVAPRPPDVSIVVPADQLSKRPEPTFIQTPPTYLDTHYSSDTLCNEVGGAMNGIIETLPNPIPGEGGSHIGTPISDAIFEANAIRVVSTHNPSPLPPVRRSEGMTVWAIPPHADFAYLTWITRVTRARAKREIVYGQARLASTFQPPRYRITYFTDVAPHRRIITRDDALAGGAQRNYPPSKSVQHGNRTTGGYL